MVASCRLVNLIYGLERPTPADEKREADHEQFQIAFPRCRLREATVIADDSPAEGDGFEPSVPRLRRNSARLAARDATRVRNTIVRVDQLEREKAGRSHRLQ